MVERPTTEAPAPETTIPVTAAQAAVPARREVGDLRDLLPGLEPERQVTDWGRSERIEGVLDRTIVEFIYRYWFRTEVEGIENVPSDGGALIVSNHAGALPPDAAMIAKSIKEEHARPRPLHLTVEHFFKGYPGFSMLLPKIGAVPAHPANVHRLLYDERQLVLVFPEGRKGTEKLYKDRYRLRRFGRGGFVAAAMKARAPLVPVAVVGRRGGRADLRPPHRAPEAHRLPVLPADPDLPALRDRRDARLPPREVQDPLPRADPDRPVGRRALARHAASSRPSPRTCASASRRTCSTCSPSARASGSGMQSRRILITGLSTFWGGRLAQRLERDPAVETVIGVDTDDPTRELERTEFVRVGNQHALIRRIVAAAEIDTVIDTRLTVDSSVASPRVAHENNVIGTMNILAACSGPDSPVKKVVFKSSSHWYGCEQDDPAFFTEEMSRPHPPRTPIEKDIVEAESAVEDFAEEPARRRSACCASSTPSARASRPRTRGCSPRCRCCPRSSASTRATSSSTRTTSSACSSTRPATTSTASSTPAATACSCSPRWPGCSASHWRRCCRRGGPGSWRARCAGLGMRIPTELLNQLRYGRGVDNRRLKATGYDFRFTSREAVQKFAEHLRIKPLLSSSREPYRYEQEVEEFLRWSPSVQVSNERAGKRWQPSERELGELERAIAVVRAADDDGGDDGSQVNRPPGARPGGESAPQAAAAPREPGYGALSATEVIDLLPSLDRRDVRRLRDVEASHQGREEVLTAIDRILAGTGAPDPGV